MLKTELLEAIDRLPNHLQQEVLHFAQFLMSKHANGAVKEGAIESALPDSHSSDNSTNTSAEAVLKKRGGYGIWKGKVTMADDFDEPLEEMKEYME